MITEKQKIKFADYILDWLKEKKLLKNGKDYIDGEQLEETCMAGATICEALVESGIIKEIGN